MIKADVLESGILIPYSETVSDSVEFETMKFMFPKSWDGLTKTAVFKSGETLINVLLDTNSKYCISENECYIPHEVIKSPEFTVSVFGVKGTKRATAARGKVKVFESGFELGDQPALPTESEYNQLVSISNEIKKIAQSVRSDADNGAFKGEKGDKGDVGEKGAPFVYSDFTEEQLANLKGEKGDVGERGAQGEKGDIGKPFTYSDFTEEQLAKLKGEKGDKGDKGEKGDIGPQGEKGLKGDKGEAGVIENIDQIFSPESENAQSGKAIADIISNMLPLSPPTKWSDIQKIVRLGFGKNYFPVGYEFKTYDSTNKNNIIWRVVGHDYHKPSDSALQHSMTLEMKHLYSNESGTYKSIPFDTEEALYYTEKEMSPGDYCFLWKENVILENDTYNFTITHSIPKGGQIVFNYNDKTITSYGEIGSDLKIETASLTKGSKGIYLGETGKNNFNDIYRAMYGSNNYGQSFIRQFINSEDKLWKPTTKFDRKPTWYNPKLSFTDGLSSDFLSVLGFASIKCHTNSIFEVDSLDGSKFNTDSDYTVNDRFFILSDEEMYKKGEESTQLEYYKNISNANIKKYDLVGNTCNIWLRSHYNESSYSQFLISYSSGSYGSSRPNYNNGISIACIVA